MSDNTRGHDLFDFECILFDLVSGMVDSDKYLRNIGLEWLDIDLGGISSVRQLASMISYLFSSILEGIFRLQWWVALMRSLILI